MSDNKNFAFPQHLVRGLGAVHGGAVTAPAPTPALWWKFDTDIWCWWTTWGKPGRAPQSGSGEWLPVTLPVDPHAHRTSPVKAWVWYPLEGKTETITHGGFGVQVFRPSSPGGPYPTEWVDSGLRPDYWVNAKQFLAAQIALGLRVPVVEGVTWTSPVGVGAAASSASVAAHLSHVRTVPTSSQDVVRTTFGWFGPGITPPAGLTNKYTPAEWVSAWTVAEKGKPTIVPPGMPANGSWKVAVVQRRYLYWVWFPAENTPVLVPASGGFGPVWLLATQGVPTSAPPYISPPAGATKDGPWFPGAVAMHSANHGGGDPASGPGRNSSTLMTWDYGTPVPAVAM